MRRRGRMVAREAGAGLPVLRHRFAPMQPDTAAVGTVRSSIWRGAPQYPGKRSRLGRRRRVRSNARAARRSPFSNRNAWRRTAISVARPRSFRTTTSRRRSAPKASFRSSSARAMCATGPRLVPEPLVRAQSLQEPRVHRHGARFYLPYWTFDAQVAAIGRRRRATITTRRKAIVIRRATRRRGRCGTRAGNTRPARSSISSMTSWSARRRACPRTS